MGVFKMEPAIIALVVSIVSLIISIYIITRNKAILVVEKHSLTLKKDKKEVWLYFYLSNIGERPTTIKTIDFYTDSKFMPKTHILRVIDKTTLGVGGDLPTSHYNQYETIDLPSLIKSHTTIKLLAKLNFSEKSIFDRETKNDKLHYTLRLEHSKKIYEKRL